MKSSSYRRWFPIAVAVLATGIQAHAQTKPAALVKWAGADIDGQPVMIPAADKVSVVAFVKPDQPQSEEAIRQIAASVKDAKDVQVIVVVSGKEAAGQAKAMKEQGKWPWPAVADPSFGISGQMDVHVWPTTLVVRPDGQQAAHLAGLPKSFSFELDAYLKFASGKFDDVALRSKLTTREVVTDSDEQKAARHLAVAQRLLEQGRTDQAMGEVDAAAAIRPDDPQIKLTRARVLLVSGKSDEAMAAIDALPPAAVPPAQRNVLRGRALIASEKWAEAKEALTNAVKLNPDPSEAHYLTGLVYQHEGDWPHAAESFRLAFETSPAGRKIAVGKPPGR